jgi:glutaminyl-tRNA synthetase
MAAGAKQVDRGEKPATARRRERGGETSRSARLEAARHRYRAELGLAEGEAEILSRDETTAALFDDAVTAGGDARAVANLIVNELPRVSSNRDLTKLRLSGAALAKLVELMETGTISSTGARAALGALAAEGGDPAAIVDRLGLRQVSDASVLVPIVDAVIAANPDKAAAYRGGRAGLMGFFVGQVMASSAGRANPERVKELLAERLG